MPAYEGTAGQRAEAGKENVYVASTVSQAGKMKTDMAETLKSSRSERMTMEHRVQGAKHWGQKRHTLGAQSWEQRAGAQEQCIEMGRLSSVFKGEKFWRQKVTLCKDKSMSRSTE